MLVCSGILSELVVLCRPQVGNVQSVALLDAIR